MRAMITGICGGQISLVSHENRDRRVLLVGES
jgi:hypothetical protein